MQITFDQTRLLPPREALERYFAAVPLLPRAKERCALDDALGRVLSDPAVSAEDVPAAARSTMDGFAVQATDLPGRLEIGREATRISTGGVLPSNANAVVPIEDTRVEGAFVIVSGRVSEGDCIVTRGADIQKNEVVLEPGRRIGAPELAVLATLGIVDVPVYRKPTVAVISGGDELVTPAQRPSDGEVRDSNRYAIAALLLALGAAVRHYPIVRDRKGELEAILTGALRECDAAVLSGGSSVGERDLVRKAIETLGGDVIVHGMRIKPGKPALLAAIEGRPVIGLPGNPASAFFVMDALGSPIIAAIVGTEPHRERTQAKLAAPLRGREGWTWFVPVRLRGDVAHPLALRSFSASLAARASGYVRLGEERAEYAAGDTVTVERFLSGGVA
jgi:molybdopterin molybdotransferase